MKVTRMKSILKVALSFVAILMIAGCDKKENAEFDNFLTRYEEIVSTYESFVNKSQFCVSDVNELNGNILPKINVLAGEGQKLQESSEKPSDDQVARYAAIGSRFSAAMGKLGEKMQSMDPGC